MERQLQVACRSRAGEVHLDGLERDRLRWLHERHRRDVLGVVADLEDTVGDGGDARQLVGEHRPSDAVGRNGRDPRLLRVDGGAAGREADRAVELTLLGTRVLEPHHDVDDPGARAELCRRTVEVDEEALVPDGGPELEGRDGGRRLGLAGRRRPDRRLRSVEARGRGEGDDDEQRAEAAGRPTARGPAAGGERHAASSNSASTNAFGSNSTRSCGRSPTPANRTGTPSRCSMAKTIPPRDVESSFVSTMPVSLTASSNATAWASPFWPVVASRTRSVSGVAPGSRRSITRRILASSSIRLDFVWSRPAVSTMTTSARRATAASRASNTTAAGSAPAAWATISAPARSAQIRSWSLAAARNVSAAARMTRRPAAASRVASLPIVVV